MWNFISSRHVNWYNVHSPTLMSSWGVNGETARKKEKTYIRSTDETDDSRRRSSYHATCGIIPGPYPVGTCESRDTCGASYRRTPQSSKNDDYRHALVSGPSSVSGKTRGCHSRNLHEGDWQIRSTYYYTAGKLRRKCLPSVPHRHFSVIVALPVLLYTHTHTHAAEFSGSHRYLKVLDSQCRIVD